MHFLSKLLSRTTLFPHHIVYLTTRQKHSKTIKKVSARYLVSDEEASSVVDLNLFDSNMKNHLDRLQTNLRNSVSLRMTTANIEEIGIKLKKSGPVEKLGDICQVNEQQAGRVFVISCPQQLIPQIKSNLDQRGFVIQEDGGSIVASVPELTTDRRNELLKLTKTWYDRIVVDMKTDLNKFVKQVRIAEKNCQKDFIRNVEETLKYRFKSVTEIAENMKNEKCNQIQGKYTN